MEVEVVLVNAFTHNEQGGNPAGVVLDSDSLSQIQKQQISKEVGLSETAFVSKSDTATYQVDFFTPTNQVAMCGHATIASWSVLKKRKNLLNGRYTQQLTNGILGVQLFENGSIVMEQKPPQYGKFVKKEILAPLLGLSATDFISSPIPQLVSTGMFDVMIGVRSLEVLDRIAPNLTAISQFQKENNEVGLHVFTLLSEKKYVARMRDFCPLLGIPEESATGSATGALLCYLYKNNLLSKKQVEEGVWFEQGYSMNKPSDIFGKLTLNKNEEVEKVEIGGKATIAGSKKIFLD